ncbi:hypothetical protein BS78_10G017000 [Paspalum vaginatum]|nr:hypothetical protein BS78_10G017000 [Paspalum vaginatum]
MAGEGEGEGERGCAFRWTDAARYVVASVVTVLIVVVIVDAVMVFHHKSLYLSVPGGSVFINEVQQLREDIDFVMTIRAQKPSGIARMYYINVTGYLFDSNISASASLQPGRDSIVYFPLHDMILEQQVTEDIFKTVTASKGRSIDTPYFDQLKEGRLIIEDATLRLDGTLITQAASSSDVNTTDNGTSTFYCRPLVVGRQLQNNGVFKVDKDVFCISGERLVNFLFW